jgi:hypothetical protein
MRFTYSHRCEAVAANGDRATALYTEGLLSYVWECWQELWERYCKANSQAPETVVVQQIARQQELICYRLTKREEKRLRLEGAEGDSAPPRSARWAPAGPTIQRSGAWPVEPSSDNRASGTLYLAKERAVFFEEVVEIL